MKLVVTFPGDQRFALQPTPAGRFALDGVDELSISFRSAGDGAVDGLLIHVPGAVHELERVGVQPE